MKHTLLFSALLLAAHGAFVAAQAAPKEDASADRAAAMAEPHAEAHGAAGTDSARQELAELRTQMQALSRRMADLSAQLGDVGPRAYAYRYIGHPDRAMIGVVLSSDKDGARISAVTPDGPAARAGLRDGDVITAIDHQAISNETPDATLANARERLSNLKESQSVHIGYRRGTKSGEVTLAAERREALNWARLMNDDPERPFLPEGFDEHLRQQMDRAAQELQRVHVDHDRIRADAERAQRDAADAGDKAARAARQAVRVVRRAMPWWGINLAPVNPDLGRYFGVDAGALVIATDADSLPGLRAGDVITHVAGAKVDRPEDVMRALRDQPSGKDVEVKLMRDRKTVALNVKAPQFESIFSVPPAPPPPAPPLAPTAPLAPLAPTPPSPPSVPE